MKILDFGCGKKKMAGAVGIDISPDTDADVVHDLNVVPYPFKDSEFDAVYADNVLEHLDDLLKVMEELHRITRDAAEIKIIVPFFRSAYAFIDPTHRHFFTYRSFDYFDPDREFSKLYKYSRARFRVRRVVFDEDYKGTLTDRLVAKLAAIKPVFYEMRLSALLPLSTLTFYLETVKGDKA